MASKKAATACPVFECVECDVGIVESDVGICVDKSRILRVGVIICNTSTIIVLCFAALEKGRATCLWATEFDEDFVLTSSLCHFFLK